MPRQVIVLLATFNGAPWLDEQLASIFAQEDASVSVSVLASDDGSTDATGEVLQRWARDTGRVRVLPNAGQRLGACGNFLRLLREAELGETDAVALADQDDIWLPGRLDTALRRLASGDTDGFSSDAIAFWPDGKRKPLGKAHAQRRFDHLFEPAGPGCTYVIGRRLALALQHEINVDPERFVGIGYHDWLIYAYARSNGYRWFIDPTPSLLYRQHAHNELGANFGTTGVTRRWERLRNGWFRHQVLRIASFWPAGQEDVIERLQRFGWADRIWLALRSNHLRRRPRDWLALSAMLLLNVLR
ncbi:glycosyltransferase [Caldimonas sp. KR1-144]|uniref:glycosyltransferase n=1 Tax=Caldimonas sp. KR1-144 TaxID=3400911 RepID=UPI003C00CC5F